MTITILLCWSIHGGLRYEALLDCRLGHYWWLYGDLYIGGEEWWTP